MDPFLGEIRIFAGNFAPVGWALCNGQILSISTNTALFSLLGIQYGGNGTSNFALPNLQGSIALGAGQGPGLGSYNQGEAAGVASVTLDNTNLPSHTHTLAGVDFSPTASTDAATTNTPGGSEAFATALDAHGSPVNAYLPATLAVDKVSLPAVGPVDLATQQSPATSDVIGGGGAHNNLQPYVVLNYIIALQGVFPPRN